MMIDSCVRDPCNLWPFLRIECVVALWLVPSNMFRMLKCKLRDKSAHQS